MWVGVCACVHAAFSLVLVSGLVAVFQVGCLVAHSAMEVGLMATSSSTGQHRGLSDEWMRLQELWAQVLSFVDSLGVQVRCRSRCEFSHVLPACSRSLC
jgi:hypothetical protein